MTKFCVKKPFIIIVAVIIVMIIGGVSLTNMRTDLLPNMELPYMLIITTEPGASPEQVEGDVTKVLESKLGTVSGVEKIKGTSSENYSMVMLQFAEDTDSNAGLVRVSQALESVQLPDGCGKPNIMEISMDMMATMYASIEYDGKDIKEITKFSNDVLIPYAERQEGVANVSATGTVEDSVEIKLDEKKINELNDKILFQTNQKLGEAQNQLKNAENSLTTAKDKLENGQNKLNGTQSKTNSKLAEGYVKISNAQATKAAYESSLNSLKASQAALQAEKKIYIDSKLPETYQQTDKVFAQMKEQAGALVTAQGLTIPSSIEEGLKDKNNLKKVVEWLQKIGDSEQTKQLSVKNLEQLYNVVKVRIPQIDAELANLKTEIAAAEKVLETISSKMEGMDEKQMELFSGSLDAAAGFGSGKAEMSSGITQIENAKKELEQSKQTLEDSKQAALKNANLDKLLSLETLSGLITAQNFSMPAGYIDDKDGKQWLVKIGEQYKNVKDLKNMVLTEIDGVGTIKLGDVANVTVIDNAGETYAKINGNDAVLLSIYKASTANTSEVSENLKEAFHKLEEQNKGLQITPMIDQADYISQMVKSILTSILFGAILAIVVLALFLKDVKPTIIVAFSIPFSVLFAIVIMYFSDMTLNMMSLAGLCLGIGMLVDNSIVVVENVYRLRGRGIAPARAAVQGAKQVAAPIIASTLTTICVFLPMIFVTGMVSQLLIPFALTITYALVASLIVALTVVPTFSSYALKNTKERTHKIFDKIKNVYAKALGFCLKVKIVPLAIAIALLVLCTWQATRTGLEMVGKSVSEQISAIMVLDPETDKETAYATADKAMELISKVDGVKKVGVMDGNATIQASNMGDNGGHYTNFMIFVIPKDDVDTVGDIENLQNKVLKVSEELECEDFTLQSSGMDSSALTGSGLQVDIYGKDQQKLISISNDIMKLMKKVEGTENVSNGIGEDDQQIHLIIDKDKAMKKGLSVAQIFQQLAEKTTNEKNSITLSQDNQDIAVKIVDERNTPTYENILDTKLTATVMNEKGEQETKTYKLSKFAKINIEDSPKSLTRLNQTEYISVTAETKDGYNTTLMSRELEDALKDYNAPEGYSVEIKGESEQVMDMVWQLLQAIALGFLLIYLVMVAQFQSLLSPFIILFTIPLAFTGGMIGLIIFGQTISAMALMGFMILMGTVVNNGIVFVDYVNQLRIQGLGKREALIATGKTRMRPILMTALTTILSMSVMVFSNDAGGATQKPMAIVVCFGLIYATFMTLFIVPVMYDILYRRKPHVVDVGEDNIDDVPDEVSEYLQA